jgi:muramoyltetrapeptide carboxypeptidase
MRRGYKALARIVTSRMALEKLKIGVVAPACRIGKDVAARVSALARRLYDGRIELVFHPQCHLSQGHFAGEDAARAEAFLDIANDEGFGALWIARGGYGAARILERVLPRLNEVARQTTYLGYSDAGFLLGALYAQGFGHVAHGPMPSDMIRDGGEQAVGRALAWLAEKDVRTIEPSADGVRPAAAFNLTILSHLVGTPYLPDLGGHVLMLEEISEHMYRIDRALFHVTSVRSLRNIAGIRLGRCSAIPPNDPEFEQNEEDVARHWCAASHIAYLGRADIGHDSANKIVPFGR